MITWQLDRPYLIDAILLVGQDDTAYFLSEFYLYVGYNSDYSTNSPCPGGPYAYPIDWRFGTYYFNDSHFGSEWPNGTESFCNLEGNFVTFVREANAEEPLNEIRICTLGIIADPLVEVNENSEVPETEEPTEEPTNLFDELIQLFDSQYPLFKIIYENETEVIALNITSNATFEAVTFEHDFGFAEQFCAFDYVNSEVEIAADSNSIGTYSLEMTLTYGADTYTRTM